MAEPTTTALGALATATKAGIVGSVLAIAKTAALSPTIGAIALGKIIVFQW